VGLVARDDLDAAFWQDVATLKAEHDVALGDAFGLALARRLDADFVTSDHHEIDAVAAAGACSVTFIR
ncbi:MAG: hypothetical protein M3347_00580, partial [Armatimonadota bacterium]|nr:hypothetical protein [Armatimonadota bacterium]